MPTRRRDPVSVPRSLYSSGRPSYSHVDYAIDDSISRAGMFSNAVLDDTDAAAARSRGKDYELLRSTQSAIIDTELHSSPRTAVASRRARAASVPPKVQARPFRLQQQVANRPKVVGNSEEISSVLYQPVSNVPSNLYGSNSDLHEVPWRLRANSVSNNNIRSLRAGSMPPVRHVTSQEEVYGLSASNTPLGTETLRAHPNVPRRLRAGSLPPQRPRSVHVTGVRREAYEPVVNRSYFYGNDQSVGTEGLRAHKPAPFSTLSRAQSVLSLSRKPLDFGIDENFDKKPVMTVPRRNNQMQGSKGSSRGISWRASSEPPQFDVRPSAAYPKIGDIEVKSKKRQLFARRGLNMSVPFNHNNAQAAIYSNYPNNSSYLHASRQAAVPVRNDRKPIRTVDGFTKQSNPMSWEHRVEARLSPDDLIYQPASFGRMRDQVRNAQDKMDRHRQLLDRYLDPDMKPSNTLVTRNNQSDSPYSSIY